MKINIFKTEEDVLANLAAHFVAVASTAIAEKGKFSVALSGGNSPKNLYELLSSPAFNEKIDWQKTDFFFGDERNVLQTSPDSNYLMAKKALFDPLQINAAQIFAVDTSFEPVEAAAKYTNDINNYFDDRGNRFDLVLLGLGDNSHTASLFPYTPVLHDNTISVKAVFLPDQQVYRITFTAPLINQARHVAFLVYGKAKAIAVQHIIKGDKDIDNYPAQLIAPVDGELQWFLDEAAAAGLQTAKY